MRLRKATKASPRYLVFAGVTFLLTLPIFAPWSVWPLAYVAFAPWLVMTCLAASAAGVYAASYVLGAAFFFTHWRWLFETTPEGYIVGCLVFGLYFTLAAWMVRHLYHRRRIPVTFAFAVSWILVEMMRSRGPLAFPWFLLGHTQIRLLSLVQVADITGVYGVSFAVAMVNGLIADLVLRRLSKDPSGAGLPTAPLQGWPAAPLAVILTLGLMFGYGWYRLSTLVIKPGPTAAVLQGDFLLKAEEDPNAPGDSDKQRVYMNLLKKAVTRQPDLIVLPETPWTMHLNKELRPFDAALLRDASETQQKIYLWLVRNGRQWYDHFRNQAHVNQTTIVVGGMSQEKQPPGVYPSEYKYNSGFVFYPDGTSMARYDKIHLVMFGEFIPFRYSIPPLYRWINGLTPWGQGGYEYSLTPGHEFRVFQMTERDHPERSHPFGITICYEDVIPQLFRRFITDDNNAKRVDFMLNISNDGWFGHGAQQAQHLVNCAFRAIENRVGVARSVNTGVSGFVRPDGSWHDLAQASTEFPRSGGTGYSLARVDSSPTVTFYTLHGDWFGAIVALVACAVIVDAVIGRRREKLEARRSRQAHA